MIDRLLVKLGLCRLDNVVAAFMAIREAQGGEATRISDRQFVEAMRIAKEGPVT